MNLKIGGTNFTNFSPKAVFLEVWASECTCQNSLRRFFKLNPVPHPHLLLGEKEHQNAYIFVVISDSMYTKCETSWPNSQIE